MSTTVYAVTQLAVSLGGRPVLGPLDVEIARGAFLGIVGPNGSGKTTLLRALTGAVQPSAGRIELEGRPLARYAPAELARMVGVVPQSFNLDFNFTVEAMVAMGRYAHKGAGEQRRAADGVAVAASLEATGMSALAGRFVTELSGGERQRALIAQTLAQETPVLLLDEPLNNLDLNHQLEVMQLLRALHAGGRTIVVVLHDLNMAAQYCDELVLLDHGRAAARGAPDDILEPSLIFEVFKVRMTVHRQGRRPYLTPLCPRVPESAPAAERARVHVIGGGGAASGLLEELVLRGYAPSVGIVSVFDTDYATAERYELEVVSAPPFEPFTDEAVRELERLVGQAQTLLVAPVFFGRGNLAPLRTAIKAAREGKRVIALAQPPISERDLSDGEATALMAELRQAGMIEVETAAQAAERL
jgi:iron complex transport system ATP-binding protein